MDAWALWRRGHTDPARITDAMLAMRAREAQRWCALQVAAGAHPRMRSERLAFEILHNGRDDAVCSLGLNRSRGLALASEPGPTPGRFLVYLPDDQLADGAAEVASQGFFDVFNTPPWDTWVSFFEDPQAHLLCWVPQRFERLADEGVQVNPEACILWLDETDLPIRARLLGAGGP